MKRRLVIIAALAMIGVVAGIALAQIMSNTAQFSIQVDGVAALNVDIINQPTAPLYQGQWYNDAITLNVSNNDVNQGYSFYLVVKVVHGGITPADINMKIKHSLGNQANYNSYMDISSTFVQESSNTINGTYYKVTTIPIDPYATGQWKVFFMISFEITGGTTGSYNFQFAAYN